MKIHMKVLTEFQQSSQLLLSSRGYRTAYGSWPENYALLSAFITKFESPLEMLRVTFSLMILFLQWKLLEKPEILSF